MLAWTVVVCLSIVTVVLASMSTAWQRACRHVTLRVLNSDAPDFVKRFTPPFVKQRESWTGFSVIATVAVTWWLLGWKTALGLFALLYVIVEVATRLFPKPSSDYYVHQIAKDLRVWIGIHTQFGNAAEAEKAQTTLLVLESALREEGKSLPAS